MAALSRAKRVDKQSINVLPNPVEGRVKGGAKIWEGALCAVDATGHVIPGASATGLVCIGVAKRTYDNTAGADGAIIGEFWQGCQRFENATAGDAVTQAEVGRPVYILDDQTVTKTATGRSVAGVCHRLEGTTVFVQVGFGIKA